MLQYFEQAFECLNGYVRFFVVDEFDDFGEEDVLITL